MDMREGASETTTYFRTDRFFRINQKYYFQCRGEADYGPYPNLRAASIMLSQYLAAKTQVRKLTAKNNSSAVMSAATATIRRDAARPLDSNPATNTIHTSRARQTEPTLKKETKPAAKKSPTKAPTEAKVATGSKHNTPPTVSAANQKASTTIKKVPPVSQKVAQVKPIISAKIPPVTAAKPKTQPQLVFKPAPVDEYVLGIIIGNISVTDVDTPFTYHVEDNRFEIIGTTLKLKDSEFFDYAADTPVVFAVLAVNDQGERCQKTIRVDIRPLC